MPHLTIHSKRDSAVNTARRHFDFVERIMEASWLISDLQFLLDFANLVSPKNTKYAYLLRRVCTFAEKLACEKSMDDFKDSQEALDELLNHLENFKYRAGFIDRNPKISVSQKPLN